MPPVGFEPTIAAGERPQTYALDRAAIGIGKNTTYSTQNKFIPSLHTLVLFSVSYTVLVRYLSIKGSLSHWRTHLSLRYTAYVTDERKQSSVPTPRSS